MTNNEITKNEYNPERRQFLKIVLIGVGAFFLGKFLDPLARLLGISKSREVLIKTSEPENNNSDASEPMAEGEFGDWKITKEKEQLFFYDKNGENILILDSNDEDK